MYRASQFYILPIQPLLLKGISRTNQWLPHAIEYFPQTKKEKKKEKLQLTETASLQRNKRRTKSFSSPFSVKLKCLTCLIAQ